MGAGIPVAEGATEVDAQTVLGDGQLLTIEQTARLLSVSRSFLYAQMDAGELPFVRLGRARRLPRRAVLEFAARHLYGLSNGHEPR